MLAGEGSYSHSADGNFEAQRKEVTYLRREIKIESVGERPKETET